MYSNENVLIEVKDFLSEQHRKRILELSVTSNKWVILNSTLLTDITHHCIASCFKEFLQVLRQNRELQAVISVLLNLESVTRTLFGGKTIAGSHVPKRNFEFNFRRDVIPQIFRNVQ